MADEAAEAAKRQRLADEIVAHRVRVARAVYSTSLSVYAVEHENDLKELLQEARARRMPIGSNLANDTKDVLSRDVLQRYTQEFANRSLLLTFDATPRRDDVCAVLFSFVDGDFNIIDRLASLDSSARRLMALSISTSSFLPWRRTA